MRRKLHFSCGLEKTVLLTHIIGFKMFLGRKKSEAKKVEACAMLFMGLHKWLLGRIAVSGMCVSEWIGYKVSFLTIR
jgi:hypothetical protein